ncbi:hypothetical protein ACUNV4_21820 [Granulosicoccus sp. 3-233]|uniref:hypothetical protein n=1 Tax=Granulosicoccus sp. 3-233 TaxID=3417969 RepID=UPI003D35805B
MKPASLWIVSVAALTLGACATSTPDVSDTSMSFFITSANPGKGADLGGLDGADAYCGALATAAGVTGKTWKAYLSSSSEDARDRIGSGPWYNASGVMVASSVENLLGDSNNLTKQTSVNENGDIVNGRGDEPNRHDILTGSAANGRSTGSHCEGWTSSGEGSATVGHHDRTGGGDDPTSWSSAHNSRGCSIEALQATGGDGLFYCFAQ